MQFSTIRPLRGELSGGTCLKISLVKEAVSMGRATEGRLFIAGDSRIYAFTP